MPTMRKMLACILGVALVATCTSATATCKGKTWDDLSWWAQSGATPGPVKDSARAGYWWWPTEPASNADDSELWGNRGVVYSSLDEPAPEPPSGQGPTPIKDERIIPALSHVLFDLIFLFFI